MSPFVFSVTALPRLANGIICKITVYSVLTLGIRLCVINSLQNSIHLCLDKIDPKVQKNCLSVNLYSKLSPVAVCK